MASRRRLSSRLRHLGVLTLGCLVAFLASPLQAQQIQVTSADPNTAPQATVNLNVLVKGKGFKNGAVAKWQVTGTEDPGGVTVNSTTFVSATELIANITVSETAVISLYDIKVRNSDGRIGKGTELFSVTEKGTGPPQACSTPTPILTSTASCTTAGQAGCLDTTFGTGGMVLVDTTPAPGVTVDNDRGKAVALQSDGKLVVAGLGGIEGQIPHSEFAVLRFNPDGTLDPAFGSGGSTLIHISDFTDELYDVHIQSDGKILVAGDSGGAYFAVARLNADGSLDTGFGSGGVAVIDFGRKGGGSAWDIAIQSDGKIILVGGGRGPDWSIARLLPNGTLDSSFGTGGKLIAKSGGGSAYAVLMQTVNVGGSPVERILVAGRGYSGGITDFGLMRLTLSGALDSSFGPSGSGKSFTDFCGNLGEYTRTIGFDSTGNIVAGGIINIGGSGGLTGHNFLIARYTPNGILDTTFGEVRPGATQASGRTIVDALAGYDSVYGMAIQPGGKIILSGAVHNVDESFGGFGLVRFNPDGSVDSSFGSGGVAVAGSGSNDDFGYKLALQPDGRLVVSGQSKNGAEYDISVFRFWP